VRKKILTYLNKFGNLEKIGAALLAAAVFLVALIFSPVIKEEIRYTFSSKNNSAKVETKAQADQAGNNNSASGIMIPVDENFSIVIPKIQANAKVIADVDSQNSAVYQRALTEGVAQAKGSAKPGEEGNIFIFAHSSNLIDANKYNAVFYLLSKLEKGDDIYLFYKQQKFSYQVAEKITVDATDASYLNNNSPEKQLTLMTCWPPGTTLKRLIIIAK
jgi:LPXTG-site transpeptidase (sortase) family protein